VVPSSLHVPGKPSRARAWALGGSVQAAEDEEGEDRFYLCFHCTASFLEDHKALAANCKVFISQHTIMHRYLHPEAHRGI